MLTLLACKQTVHVPFTCIICEKDFKDPQLNNRHQTRCCRQHFCESCLEQCLSEDVKKSRCPHCQAEELKFVDTDKPLTCTCDNNGFWNPHAGKKSTSTFPLYRIYGAFAYKCQNFKKIFCRQLQLCIPFGKHVELRYQNKERKMRVQRTKTSSVHKPKDASYIPIFRPNRNTQSPMEPPAGLLPLSNSHHVFKLQSSPITESVPSKYDGIRPKSKLRKKKVKIKRMKSPVLPGDIHPQIPPLRIQQCNGGKGNGSSGTQDGKKASSCSSYNHSGTGSNTHSSVGGAGSASGGAGGDDNEDGRDRDKWKDVPDSDEEDLKEDEEESTASSRFDSNPVSHKNEGSQDGECVTSKSKAAAQSPSLMDSREQLSQIGQSKTALTPPRSVDLASNDAVNLETVDGKHAPTELATVGEDSSHDHLASSTDNTSDTPPPSNDSESGGHQVSANVETETNEGQNAPSTIVSGLNSSVMIANFVVGGATFLISHTCPSPPASSQSTASLLSPAGQQHSEPPPPLHNFNITIEADPLDLAPIDPIHPYPAPIPEDGP